MKIKNFLPVLSILFIGLYCISCGRQEGNSSFKPELYRLDIPRNFPSKLNIPIDNPLTVPGVSLGRHLFYDGRLSGRTETDSLMSCSSCHIQKNAFEVGMDHPKYTDGKVFGLSGIPTPHSMLPLFNTVFCHEGYLWNGLVHANNKSLGMADSSVPPLPVFHYKNLESLVWMGIVAPHEMNGQIQKTVDLIASIHTYPPMFEAAFGTPEVNIERISKAIAQFVRTLVSANSKFDQYLRGETSLTDDEMKGYILFSTEEGADCFHCHGGSGNALFTTYQFMNNGLDNTFNDPGDRYSVTKKNTDKGAYKIPSLRNIEYTAPYMHDGRFKTLDDVIDFYSEGVQMSSLINPLMHHAHQNGVQLTEEEKRCLKAFLLTLSDHEFINNPKFSKPQGSRLP